jgi:hypothetical protein
MLMIALATVVPQWCFDSPGAMASVNGNGADWTTALAGVSSITVNGAACLPGTSTCLAVGESDVSLDTTEDCEPGTMLCSKSSWYSDLGPMPTGLVSAPGVYRSTDGGSSWARIPVTFSPALTTAMGGFREIQCPSSTTCFAASQTGVAVTHNRGST